MVPHLLLAVPVVPSQPLKLLNRQTDRNKREREQRGCEIRRRCGDFQVKGDIVGPDD